MTSSKTVHNKDDRSLNAILSKQTPEQLHAIGTALAEAAAESQALLHEVMSSSHTMIKVPDHSDPLGLVGAYSKVGQSLATNPTALLNANLDLWMGWVNLWKDFTLGDIAEAKDRRFSDPEWSSNPAFEFMRRAYELNSEWMMSVLHSADDLTTEERRKATFYTRQTIDALSPTNFFATNPAALKAMIESGGQSLVEGLRNARRDVERGRGRLSISQTDETPFEVGKNVATAPGKVVFRNELIELLQFEPTTDKVYSKPLLILPPWINKYYIMDLREENSLIRWLVERGLTVFVVSWRSADEVTRDYTWDSYVENGVFAALDEVLDITESPDLNAVGYCIGGTLLTSALGVMARTKDERISSATFFASQADFTDAGDLLVFTDEKAREKIDQVISANNGLMPGELMGETFNWLRPVDLVWRYVIDNYMLGKKPRPFDLLFWNADQTNIPGAVHRTYLHELYGENQLSEGRFKVLGEPVRMQDISIPVTMQASREDHICPWPSIYRAAQKYGGDVNFILAGSGHIAGVINHPGAEKYQHWTNGSMPETAEAWLTGAEESKGSWWPEWWEWLEPKSGELRDAEPVEDRRLGLAPGTYVKMRMKDIAEGKTPSSEYSAPTARAPHKKKKSSAEAGAAPSAKTKAATPKKPAKGAKAPAPSKAKAKKPAKKGATDKAGKKSGGKSKAQGKSGAKTPRPSV